MKNMNRKQKIIVSITGIFLVLLILVGLTYAYFLTKINGNTNAKSISVTTADLKLTYGDGNGIIAPTDKLLPGTTLQSKTFTVTNEGDSKTEYGVIFDKVFNELSRQQDLVYTLNCTSTIGNCNGVSNETIFPNGGGTKDNGTGYGIAVTNSIEKNAVHTYTLVVKYLDPNVDQSEDMGKTIQARVNIADLKSLNPYSADTTNTIAKAVVNNAIAVTSAQKAKGYAEFLATPKTTPAKVATSENESSLSMTTDDNGITYYYRGNVTNNYVDFAGMCWRIVRIAGDGSLKLILEDGNATCDHSSFTGNWITSQDLTTWYNSKLKSKESKLKSESACLGDLETKYNLSSLNYEAGVYTSGGGTMSKTGQLYEYDTFNRLKNGNSSLRCNGDKATASYIYEITADEVAYAGCISEREYAKTYLINDFAKKDWTNTFRTISLAKNFDGNQYYYRVTTTGMLYSIKKFNLGDTDSYASYNALKRPMVTLKKGTVFSSGDGFKTTPYVVS